MNMFAQALKETEAKTKPAKKKNGAPLIKLTDRLKEMVDQHKAAKKKKKEVEATISQTGAELIKHTRKTQDSDGFDGDFHNSYELPGNNGSLKFVSTNRFSINPDDETQIREILGSNFDNLIEVKHNVTLRNEVFEDENLQQELMNAVGDCFSQFFETKKTIVVKDEFDRKVYQVVDDEKTLEILRTFVRQYKPALR